MLNLQSVSQSAKAFSCFPQPVPVQLLFLARSIGRAAGQAGAWSQTAGPRGRPQTSPAHGLVQFCDPETSLGLPDHARSTPLVEGAITPPPVPADLSRWPFGGGGGDTSFSTSVKASGHPLSFSAPGPSRAACSSAFP